VIKQCVTVLIHKFCTCVDDRPSKVNDDEVILRGEVIVLAPGRGGPTDTIISMSLEGFVVSGH